MVAGADGHNGHGDGPDYPLDKLQRTFLYTRAHTIYGGSNQVQRNVLGERVLGLPRSRVPDGPTAHRHRCSLATPSRRSWRHRR